MTHASFDDAHYTSSICPPGPVLLYQIGHPDTRGLDIIEPCWDISPYPDLHIKLAINLSCLPLTTPLPIQDFNVDSMYNARAEKLTLFGKTGTL